MEMIKRFDTYIKEELYPSSVGMVGYNSGASGYPLDNVLTATGDVDPALHDVLKNQQVKVPRDQRRKKKKDQRVRGEIAKTIDTLSEPVRKAVNEEYGKDDIIVIVEVEDRSDVMKIKVLLEKLKGINLEYNDRIDTLELFPNWLFIELSERRKSIYINYWSDTDEGGMNRYRVMDSIEREPSIYTLYVKADETRELMRKVTSFLGVMETPNYTPKKITRDINEGSETTPYVGSGTNVGFGDASLKFTKSAGQAVYGGDSESAFAGNSTGQNVEMEVEIPPKHRFRDAKRRKERKNKESRPYGSIGKVLDRINKVSKKVNNENMKTWEEFNRLNEDEGGGGVSSATLGSTGGMGAVVSAQPSSVPGDVAGSTPGSGDIGQPLGVYTQQPAGKLPEKRKRNRKDKRDKPYHKIGAGIDNFYVTKYTETKNNGGRIIASWDTFGDTK